MMGLSMCTPKTNTFYDDKPNIWIAASDGDLSRVAELLQSGASVNAQDEFGYTPL